MEQPTVAAEPASDPQDSNDRKRPRRRRGGGARGARRGNSLLALLDALVGKRLLFELRDDAVVSGRLAEVDDRGAFIVVEDATWHPPPCREFKGLSGAPTPAPAAPPPPKLPSVHIRGRALRFVHLPGSLDPAAAIEAHRATVVAQRVAAARELLARRHGRVAKGDGGAGYCEGEEEGEGEEGGSDEGAGGGGGGG